MKILAVLPHFQPDVAPTGVIGSRLVEEFGALGHHVEVVTSLPWYEHHAVLPEWQGKTVRRQECHGAASRACTRSRRATS